MGRKHISSLTEQVNPTAKECVAESLDEKSVSEGVSPRLIGNNQLPVPKTPSTTYVRKLCGSEEKGGQSCMGKGRKPMYAEAVVEGVRFVQEEIKTSSVLELIKSE